MGTSGRDWTGGWRAAVRCGQVSYLLWALESLKYNRQGIGLRCLELRLLGSADNYELRASLVPRT